METRPTNLAVEKSHLRTLIFAIPDLQVTRDQINDLLKRFEPLYLKFAEAGMPIPLALFSAKTVLLSEVSQTALTFQKAKAANLDLSHGLTSDLIEQIEKLALQAKRGLNYRAISGLFEIMRSSKKAMHHAATEVDYEGKYQTVLLHDYEILSQYP